MFYIKSLPQINFPRCKVKLQVQNIDCIEVGLYNFNQKIHFDKRLDDKNCKCAFYMSKQVSLFKSSTTVINKFRALVL